jgi:hypothetical protein
LIQLIAATALVLGVGAGSVRAEEVVGDSVTRPRISAYLGSAAWSSYDRSTRRFHLSAYHAGATERLPVRSFNGVVDVDLGPGPDGQLVAVYSRCRGAGSRELVGDGGLRTGCDLYRYSFRTRRERKIRAFSSKASSELLPSVWGMRIAFARTRTDRRGGSCVSSVWVGDLKSGRARRLGRGTLGYYKGPPPCYWTNSPTSIDLRGRRVAFSWYYAPKTCGEQRIGLDDDVDASELWIWTLSGHRTRVESRCGGNRYKPVSWLAGAALYMNIDSDSGSPGNYDNALRAFDLGTMRYSEAVLGSRETDAVTDGEQIFFSRVLRPAAGFFDLNGDYEIVSAPLPSFQVTSRDRR